MSTGPLRDVKVLDFTGGIAGALTTLQMADAGADVVKVEPLSGDPLRGLGPETGGERAMHLMLNRDKQSVALDLDSSRVTAIVKRLAAGADVVVRDRSHKAVPEYSELRRSNESLVYCSISPWGDSGPYAGLPGTELEIQGMTGHMWFLGEIGSPPVRAGADIAEVAGGMHAFTCIIAALLWRPESGGGQSIEVSLAGSLLSVGSHWMADFSNPDEFTGGVTHPYEIPEIGYKTKDGQVIFGLLGLKEERRETWHALCERLGLQELLKDPWMAEHGAGYVGVGKDAQQMKPILEEAMKDWTREDFVEMMGDLGARVAPFLTYEDLYGDPPHPEAEANGVFISIEGDDGSDQRVVLSPWAANAGLSRTEHGPAPRLGAHTASVLARFGLNSEEIEPLKQAGLAKE